MSSKISGCSRFHRRPTCSAVRWSSRRPRSSAHLCSGSLTRALPLPSPQPAQTGPALDHQLRVHSEQEQQCHFHCPVILSSSSSPSRLCRGSQPRCSLPWWLSAEEPSCQCSRLGPSPWARQISWRKKWQPSPVFLPGKSHGQRSLAGYSPWGCKRVRHDLQLHSITTTQRVN